MYLDMYIIINKIITHIHYLKTLIYHSSIRCATAELNLQRRYDDSVTKRI